MTFKSKFFRKMRYIGSYKNFRHYRGHGIHSPFVYNFVRNVIMQTRVNGSDTRIYDAMRNQRLTPKASAQLQNLYSYLDFKGYMIVSGVSDVENYNAQTLYIVTDGQREDKLGRIIEGVRKVNGYVVVLYPRHTLARMRFLERLRNGKEFLSIDNRRYLLLFFSDKLPRQHYKL